VFESKVFSKFDLNTKLNLCFSDNKLFGAYLSYHFSTNMDKFAKEQTRDAVSVVRDELINLGFTIHDEIKDGMYIESEFFGASQL